MAGVWPHIYEHYTLLTVLAPTANKSSPSDAGALRNMK